MNLPQPILQLIEELAKLPGVGRKTAKRLAFSILLKPDEESTALAKAITTAKLTIRSCSICHGFSDSEICQICSDPRRVKDVICVVEDPRNIFTIENSNVFQGVYHVLQGAISPLHGISPDKLKIAELVQRVEKGNIAELILSTNPTLEGEATAHYLVDLFKDKVNKITRIARGMPAGADLEFADSNTLARAFEGRTDYD
ncbi:MAG: recombination mediator RecR [Proteobacteria bacterium]|nr:recombination mediator RecR [Pseudomonadota bacterium]